MTLYTFKHPKFITTAMRASGYPVLRDNHGDLMTEIAVVGRSNVGKSSLLNHLFQSPGLVKTSATPGKTQAINFFTLNDQLGFVDLPGYGYAKVPLNVRKKWAPMIEGYLHDRETLKLILFLFDIRRLPNEEDTSLIEWMSYHNIPTILVLTKTDKVTLNERNTNTKKILNSFGVEELPYVHYSTTKNIGRNELIKSITESLAKEQHGTH